MRQVVISQTGSGNTAPVPMNQYTAPFNVGFACIVGSDGTTPTYTVQYTFDDVFAANYSAAAGTWFNHADVAAETTNQSGNFAFNVTAIRLNVSAGTGTVTMYINQAGIGS